VAGIKDFQGLLKELKAEEMADCCEEVCKEVLGGFLPCNSLTVTVL
jgi:hypothetical protein